MFDNDSIPEGNADNQDISETESEEGPDLSVLDLYLKLFNLFNCLSNECTCNYVSSYRGGKTRV